MRPVAGGGLHIKKKKKKSWAAWLGDIAGPSVLYGQYDQTITITSFRPLVAITE